MKTLIKFKIQIKVEVKFSILTVFATYEIQTINKIYPLMHNSTLTKFHGKVCNHSKREGYEPHTCQDVQKMPFLFFIYPDLNDIPNVEQLTATATNFLIWRTKCQMI